MCFWRRSYVRWKGGKYQWVSVVFSRKRMPTWYKQVLTRQIVVYIIYILLYNCTRNYTMHYTIEILSPKYFHFDFLVLKRKV